MPKTRAVKDEVLSRVARKDLAATTEINQGDVTCGDLDAQPRVSIPRVRVP
jgi:hypothetical protein